MFEYSECAEDLWDPKVSILVEERSNIALSKANEQWYYTNWDTEYIKEYSNIFHAVEDDYRIKNMVVPSNLHFLYK